MTATAPTPPATQDVPPSGNPATRWPVFIASLVGVLGVALWAIVAPGSAESVIAAIVAAVTAGFGWFYILLATCVVAFVVFVAISRYGRVRLGPDHSRPEYSTFSWAAMLFAAGIGTQVEIECDGEREQEAMQALVDLVNDKFGEGE